MSIITQLFSWRDVKTSLEMESGKILFFFLSILDLLDKGNAARHHNSMFAMGNRVRFTESSK